MAELKKNTPTADILMTSMRSMGYTFEAAIADVIDNSISAHAHRIDLNFPIDPQTCFVAICDDGDGMSKEQLFDAMKYGSQNKKNHRNKEDLGRFGLGLKAASLSQCRKLSVISKRNGMISALRWDLDIVEENKEWDIIEYKESEIPKMIWSDYLDNLNNGTVVLWEEFDVLEKNAGSVYAELSKYQELVSNYLSLIFHRFLAKEKPNNLEIYINNFKLEGLDPFLEKHKKTNIRRRIAIPINDSEGVERIVTVQPYVLPFQKDMSAEDKKLVGGIEDYRTKQGFYIYRNERLIIWGTWFGRARGELTKHARVKVDIPNTLDDIWCIDIKKQAATIPNIIKNQLKKAVDEAMDIAVRAQTYRGRVQNVNDSIDYIWNRVKGRDDSYSYSINRNSIIFDLVKSKVNDDTWNYIEMVLDEIERAVPYQQIYIDKSQNKVIEKTQIDVVEDIETKAKIILRMIMSIDGCSESEAIERVFSAEPFNNYPEIKEKLGK